MESEKVKEIKEALAQNSGYIPFINEYEVWDEVCYADILTLINELESENERLLNQRNKTFNIWVKDTEKLKDRIAELEKELTNDRVFYKDGICYPMNCQGTLKQFAERLKAKMPCEEVFKGIWDKIDETLKEFINE